MELKVLVNKYWHTAVGIEQKLSVPAAYLLSHAIIETKNAEQIASEYEHGFEFIVIDTTNKFKKFFVDIYNEIKSWFYKGEKLIVSEAKKVDDNIIDFLDNVNYHNKFQYIQSVSKFAEYLYKGKNDEEKLTSEFKFIVQEILQLIHN